MMDFTEKMIEQVGRDVSEFYRNMEAKGWDHGGEHEWSHSHGHDSWGHDAHAGGDMTNEDMSDLIEQKLDAYY